MGKAKVTKKSTAAAGAGSKNRLDEVMYQRGLFVSLALKMSWQLALVVVVPIVGGYKLDEYLHISLVWTIVGSGLAALGVFALLRHVVAEAEHRAYSDRLEERQ